MSTLQDLFKILDEKSKSNEKIIIAIDGPCTSGKSTLGDLLKERYSATLFHTDDYFLDPSRKTIERLSESGGNFDYERMKFEIFDNLDKRTIVSNHFNCKTNQLESRKSQPNTNIIILEGSYSLHHTLFDYYTLKIFLTIDSDTQIERIIARNGNVMLQRFIREWIPLENNYFITENLKSRVDLLLKLDIF